MKELKERLVAVSKPVRELDESELNSAFGGVMADSPIWMAVTQLLLEEYEAKINETMHPQTIADYGSLAGAAGGMQALNAFYGQLNDRFKAAHQIAPREEA
jgi:hypothetical protein